MADVPYCSASSSEYSAASRNRGSLSTPNTPTDTVEKWPEESPASSVVSNRAFSTGSIKMIPNSPDYLRPVVRSAVRRWRRLHEETMMNKLMEIRNEKKLTLQTFKQTAKKLARKIPTEILAKDWLQDNQATVDVRAYLVDKVFPTLILGVEKLLEEADTRGLAKVDVMDPNFNPLNFLAQYLLRNNPKYSNFSEASPYVRGLRQVGEELRQQLFEIEGNRLARIKAEARRKREEREARQRVQMMEKERRHDCYQKQFTEWKSTSAGKVEMALLQNSLRSFADLVELYPEEMQKAAQFSLPLDPTDESGQMVTASEFAQYLTNYTGDLPGDIFDQFIVHLSKCAHANFLAVEREVRRIILTNLFMACDHSGVGILDRHRILDLFESFYDVSGDDVKRNLRNPRRWPVVELDETEDSLSDEEDFVLGEPTESGAAEDMVVKAEQKPEEDQQKAGTDTQKEGEVTEEGEGGEEKKDKEKQPEDETEGSGQAEQETKAEVKVEVSKDAAEDKEPEEKEGQEKSDKEDGAEDKVTEDAKKVEASETEQETAADSSATEAVTNTEAPADTQTSELSEKEQATQKVVEKEQAAQEVTEKEQAAQKVTEKEQDEAEAAQEQAVPDKPANEGEYDPANTGRMSVTFANNTEFDREIMTAGTATSMQSQMSAFDENTLNVRQFVTLTENFIGDQPTRTLFETMLRFIKEGYEETEEEKLDRLIQARKEAQSSKRKAQMDSLFEKWDNDGSGFLDLEEVEAIMLKYKEGQESEALSRAKENLLSKSKYNDLRLSKGEFRTFVQLVVDEIPGDIFEYFIEFMDNSVETSYADRVRGDARKKWLQQIITAAETSAGSMEPVYKAVFQALFRDAESHGNGKKISANIAMLERNVQFPDRGDVCLRYVAATTEDADYVLNKILYKDMKGISFSAIDTGKPIHVPRVSNHGNIMFWNTHRHRDEREGSLIVIPLKDRRKRVFGVMGIDTLADPHTKAIFITHEIQFFQGIAKSFSISYHHVDMRKKLMRITASAVSWIQRRSPHVTEVVFYIMEPDGKGHDYVLRKMMTTDNRGNAIILENPQKMARKDNLFIDYLFKAVDNSESVTADAYGERHLAFPLRDEQGKAVAIIDISIGSQRKLPPHENKEVQRMLRLLQMAHKEIEQEFAGQESTRVLDAEKDDNMRMDIMFDRLMLMELRENVSKLDAQAYAELKSYDKPPPIILDILKATLSIFYLGRVEGGELDDWNRVKSLINGDLCQKIAVFDPTAQDDLLPSDKIEKYLSDVPHGEVAKYGSLPAQHMYNWVFVCLSLIDHTRKMRQNKQDSAVSAGEATPSEN